jgi:hypothetical protein
MVVPVEKIEWEIKNGQSRKTYNIGTQDTKTNKTNNTKQKTERMSITDSQKTGINPGSREDTH